MTTTDWYRIDITEDIATKLDTRGGSQADAARALERAINRALDAEGWPKDGRGRIAIPIAYWYVIVWNRHGELHGHVGPIHEAERARRTAQSWQSAGYRAKCSPHAIGKPLTNPGLAWLQ